MCGLAGSLSMSGVTAPDVLQSMARRLHHRGPDDQGVWADPEQGLALVHARLAIQDLSAAGAQPMRSSCGRYVIAFNGEIYNHQDLRDRLAGEGRAPAWRGHSDTETLLAAIAAWGLKATLQSAEGMWALALWDQLDRTLQLARDRAGEKPLYWGWQGQGQDRTLLFGSELKALVVHPACERRIDRDALTALFRYKNLPAPLSIYQGIFKLRPGQILTVSREQPEPRFDTYWSVCERIRHALANPFTGDFTEAVQATESALQAAVRAQRLSDVPLGAFLSGGVDSSLIVALLQSQSERPIRTFTIGFDAQGFDESPHAEAVARHLGTQHTTWRINDREAREVIPELSGIWCEPFADSSQIPTLLVSRVARRDVTVALSGDAGDELFAGYNRYVLTDSQWHRISKLPLAMRRMLASLLTTVPPSRWTALAGLLPGGAPLAQLGDKLHKAANVLTAPDVAEVHRRLLCHWPDPAALVPGASEPATVFDEATQALDGVPDILRMQSLDFVGYLADDILAKVDRAAMSTSLETRVPFLHTAVMDLAWSIPTQIHLHRGQSKALLREVLYRHVPKPLIERPKMGFGVPLAQWLRGPLRSWAEDFLSELSLKQSDCLAVAPIRSAWEEHLTGRRNHAYRLWDVLMFQAWHEQAT